MAHLLSHKPLRTSLMAAMTMMMSGTKSTLCAITLIALLCLPGLPQQANAQEAANILARKGNTALIRKQNEKAILSFSEALSTGSLQIYTKASIYNDRGLAYARLKKYELALKDFNSAIEQFPEYAIAYNNRGLLLNELGYPEEAIKDFNRAIALQPTEGAVLHNRGNALLKAGNEPNAFKDYGKAISLLDDKSASHFARGKIHWGHNRHYAALRELNQALDQNKNQSEALFNRGQVYLSLGNKKAAINDINKAVDLNPESNDYKMFLAKIYLDQKQYSNAQRLFSQILELEPVNAEAMILRGRALGARGIINAALDDLDQAVSLTTNAASYAERALIRAKNNMPDLANEDMDASIQKAPKTARTWVALGQAAQKLDLPSNAERYFLEALKRDNNNVFAITGLYELGLREKDSNEQYFTEEDEDWKIIEPEKGKYQTIHPKYKKLKIHLDLYGSGKPKILEWTILSGKYKGFGLLRYEAGRKKTGSAYELVAVLNLRKQTVLSIEPYRWGKRISKWDWGDYNLLVRDPDGIENKIALKSPPKRRPPVLADDGNWWNNNGFFGAQPKKTVKKKKKRYRKKKKKKGLFGIFGF